MTEYDVGELMILDGSRDSGLEVAAAVGFDGDSHTEPVTKVAWTDNVRNLTDHCKLGRMAYRAPISPQESFSGTLEDLAIVSLCQVVSVSGDGQVLVHTVTAKAKKVSLDLYQR